MWTYGCSHATPAPDPDGCAIEGVTNTGRVTVPGAADTDGTRDAAALPAAAPCPDIAIQKLGPATAVAGTPLVYTLYVTNIGEVAFAAEDVAVSDPACDAPPGLIARFDGSARPRPLAGAARPRRTSGSTAARTPRRRPAPTARRPWSPTPPRSSPTSRLRAVEDSDSADTPLTCPPGPPPMPPGPASAAGRPLGQPPGSGADPAAARRGHGRRREPQAGAPLRAPRDARRRPGQPDREHPRLHRRPPRRRAGGPRAPAPGDRAGQARPARPAATASPRRSASSAARPRRRCGSCGTVRVCATGAPRFTG